MYNVETVTQLFFFSFESTFSLLFFIIIHLFIFIITQEINLKKEENPTKTTLC